MSIVLVPRIVYSTLQSEFKEFPFQNSEHIGILHFFRIKGRPRDWARRSVPSRQLNNQLEAVGGYLGPRDAYETRPTRPKFLRTMFGAENSRIESVPISDA